MSKAAPQVVAAAAAAIAEELGADVAAIRIVTFREVGGKRPAFVSRRGYTKYQLEDELK